MDTPYVTHIFDTVHSTQETARRLRGRSGSADSVLVVADRQGAGRGRAGARWVQSARPMLASIAMADTEPAVRSLISLAAGVAAVDAIQDHWPVALKLKWPNDLITSAGKVGGILTERADGQVVVGCGVNLYWPDPIDGAAALVLEDPGAEAGRQLARSWAHNLLATVAGGAEAFPFDRYTELCATIGTAITWDPDGAGRAVGVASDGGLIVDGAEGRTVIRSGEVRHVRPATIHAAKDPGDGEVLE